MIKMELKYYVRAAKNETNLAYMMTLASVDRYA